VPAAAVAAVVVVAGSSGAAQGEAPCVAEYDIRTFGAKCDAVWVHVRGC
jgi:hypothetical protein